MKWYLNTNWMKPLLIVAGVYHILYGAVVFIVEIQSLDLGYFKLPEYSMLWQLISAMGMSYGLGYIIASFHPFRHWLVIMMGTTFHILVAFMIFYFMVIGKFPQGTWVALFSNHVIWIAPFGLILVGAFEQNRKFSEQLNYFYSSRAEVSSFPVLTNKGASLTLLSESSPVLLVFLRHFGCTFCRETLKSIARDRQTIEALGTKIVLVHMSEEHKANEITGKYGLNNLHRISDPDKILYDAFALERGSFRQLFGMKVLIRGILAGVFGRNFIGAPQGDTLQLPGIFLIYKGEVVKSYRHNTAADTPDYIVMANCETCL